MKLGTKEGHRWKSLAELFADFQDQYDPLSFQERPLPEPSSTETTNPVPTVVADSEEDEAPSQESMEPTEADPEPEPRTAIFAHAQAFFSAAPWVGGSGSVPAGEPAAQAPPITASTGGRAARDFFSRAPWSRQAQDAPYLLHAKRGSLNKLMAVATEQAVLSSRERAAENGSALRDGVARFFFSQAPWKQSA